MITKRVISLWHIILFAACVFAQGAKAQGPDTFTFGTLDTNHCSDILSWDGVAAGDPNNPYPANMGAICFALYPQVYSSITPPWQLGYPNNGFLESCQPTVWGPLNFTSGNQTTAGSTGTQTVSFSGCYDGGNTAVNATVNFTVVKHVSCGRYRCNTFYSNVIQGGSGTISNPPTT